MADQNFRVKRGLEVGIGATVLSATPGGNVGVGTTNPTSKLHIQGDVRITGVVTATTFNGQINAGVSTISVNSSSDALRITQTGTGNALVVEDSSNPDSNPFVVNASGQVGIGTTNPFAGTSNSGLDVVGSINPIIFSRNTDLTGNSQSEIWAADGDWFSVPSYKGVGLRNYSPAFTGNIFGNIPYASGGALAFQNTNYGLIYTNGGSPLIFATVSVEALRIDVSQRVGIGITTPTTTLDVNGGVRIRGALYDKDNQAGNSNQVLISTGSGVDWVDAAPPNAITGLTVRDEGTIVGGANSVSQLNFVGNIVSVASTLGIATITFLDYVSNAGVATYASTAGVATALQNARTFEITGDIIASPISFNGTGNVSLAATIQPNSVALGSDTTGDYVQSISGTANQITVTGGTGESSTPTLSIPNQFTAPQDVTVTRDLQVTRNLNVNGNITIGGTSATIFSQSLNILDPDIVLGYRTDAFGNDVSNDNTANHGGVALASTEGSPLVQLFIAGIETNPATYKKIMWFKAGTFSGLGTDAWLSNYAVGIGSTQFPTGTRLAAGNIQFTQNDLAVVRNINASGIVTAQQLNVSGATTVGFLTATNIWNSGITTSSKLTLNGANNATTYGGQIFLNGATGNRIDFVNAGVAAPSFTTRSAGTKISLWSDLSGSAVDYAIGIESLVLWSSIPQANSAYAHRWYAGTSILADFKGSGELIIGSTSLTGTASQRLQVTGGAYVSGSVGIGTTNPQRKLHLRATGADGVFLDNGDQSGNSVGPLLRVRGQRVDGNVSQSFSGQLVLEKWRMDASIQSGQNLGAIIFGGNFDTLPGITTGMTYGASIGAIAEGTFSGISTAPTAIVFNTGTVGLGTLALSNVTYGTEAARITSNRNLLIGTTSETGTASQRLQVTGGAYVSGNLGVGATNPQAKLSVGSGSINDNNLPVQISTPSASGQIYYGANNNGSYGALFGYDKAAYNGGVIRVVGATDNIDFVVNNTTRAAIITSAGNLGIGTTNPTETLTVTGKIQVHQDSSSNNRLIFRGQPGSSYRWNIDNYSSANEFRIFREDDATALNGATYLSISTTGTVTASKFSGDGSLLTNLPSTGSGTNYWLQTSAGISTLSNVGIGTTNPTFKTHILDTGVTGAGLLVQGGGGGAFISKFERVVGGAGTVSINASSSNPQFRLESAAHTISAGLNNAFGGFEIADNTVIGQNTRFFVARSTGNVGIGTTNPTSKLTVIGDATITNPGANALAVRSGASGSYANFNIGRTTNEASISVAGNAGEFANNASAGDVVIRTDSTSAKILFTNGATNSTLAIAGNNVLVGTVSSTGTSSQPLQVTGGAYVSGNLGVGNTNAEGIKLFVSQGNPAANRSVALITDDGTIPTMTSGATLRISNDGSGSTFALLEAESSAGRLVFTNAGNLGVGTTNPAETLHVLSSTGRGRFQETGTGANFSILINPGQAGGPRISIGSNGDNSFIEFGSYNNINNLDTKARDLRIFSTAAPNAFTLQQSTGNIGINTTSPQGTLQVGAGTSTFIVTGIGSVGIGTTIPTSALTISRSQSAIVSAGSHLNLENPAGSNQQTTLAFTFGGTVRSNIRSDGNGNLVFNALNNSFYINNDFGISTFSFLTQGSSTPWMQVTGGNKVGIATNNATATLQVKDALAFETTNTTTTNTNQVAVDTFATATFRSAKYQVQVTCPGQISTLGGITTGGRGYTAGTYNVTFTTSSGNGSAAQGTLVVSNGTVGAIGLGATGGSGYVTGDVLTASGGSGLQVSVASTASPTGRITGLTLTSAGIGYTAGVGVGTTALTLLGGTGTGAVGLATIFDGVITSSTLLQQPTTGTGGTVFYSGSNYSTASVLSVTRSDLTNTITTITTSGISTFTSLTAHGLFVNDIIRSSSTSNGLTAGTNYYVVSTPTTTTFTLGTSIGVPAAFTAGTSLSIGFYRDSANAGGQVAYANAITGVSTNYQVSDLMVLQNGTTADFIEYATIANNDILGTFASDISGSNARLLFTPTYPNNNVKVARQAITV